MTFGTRVRQLREAKGLTQGQLSAEVRKRGGKLSQPQISAIEAGTAGRPGSILELAAALGVTPEALLDVANHSGGASFEPPKRSHTADVVFLDHGAAPPQRHEMPKDVPVLGTVVGGASGDFMMNGDTVEFVRRPPRLADRRDVFAVYVQGVSMEPRYVTGELLYLEGNRPPHNGDFVVVECKPSDGDNVHPAYLKQLIGVTPTKYRLRQFNPSDTIEIDKRRVHRVFRVMSLMDLLGV